MAIVDLLEGAEAAELAAAEHARLIEFLPLLPGRSKSDYESKLDWLIREGDLLGLREGGTLRAFLGGFRIENFRNAGPGAFCPDWCHGYGGGPVGVSAADAVLSYRKLYSLLARRWTERGIRIHGAAAYSTDAAALEAFSLTGFGRIVMDAAAGAEELGRRLRESGDAESAGETKIRKAGRSDAERLAELNAKLARHIGASPVFMPNTRSATAGEWEAWIEGPEALCFVAELRGRPFAYVKAEAPQFDVSDAVHGERTLSINGLYVDGKFRRRGAASLLLAALVAEGRARGKELISVDCETTNLEAYAFWTRRFSPVAWGFERRV